MDLNRTAAVPLWPPVTHTENLTFQSSSSLELPYITAHEIKCRKRSEAKTSKPAPPAKGPQIKNTETGGRHWRSTLCYFPYWSLNAKKKAYLRCDPLNCPLQCPTTIITPLRSRLMQWQNQETSAVLRRKVILPFLQSGTLSQSSQSAVVNNSEIPFQRLPILNV